MYTQCVNTGVENIMGIFGSYFLLWLFLKASFTALSQLNDEPDDELFPPEDIVLPKPDASVFPVFHMSCSLDQRLPPGAPSLKSVKVAEADISSFFTVVVSLIFVTK